MDKVLFVCHGNICRSPMAEYILKDYIDKYKLDIYCESRAVSLEEIRNDIYPPVKRLLDEKGIKYNRHYAKRITIQDYEEYDYIFVMDDYNLRNIKHIINDNKFKIYKLLQEDIEDPWYTGNFDKVFEQIDQGIRSFLEKNGYIRAF